MRLDVPQASSSQLWLNQTLNIENRANGKLYHDHEVQDLKISIILEELTVRLINVRQTI